MSLTALNPSEQGSLFEAKAPATEGITSLFKPSEVFLDRVLEPPSYGFTRDEALYVPTHAEIWKEFAGKLNIFATRKNWLPFVSWLFVLSLVVPFILFFVATTTWPLFAIGFVYGMVVLGSHGTIWLHRYSTHRAYQFKSKFYRFIVRNLVIKLIHEEVYVLSHHVHHYKSEKPGDPYNSSGGWLYCFLADATHQGVRQDLSELDYKRVASMMEPTGMRLNTYAQYLKWGSVSHPLNTIAQFVLNWAFWGTAFYWMGGMPLVITMFAWAGIWGIGVRTYNYDGHGGGKDKKQDGNDFYRADNSINQFWPGYVAGEWHNNHHLYPSSAQSGFLPYQLDLAWLFIRGSEKLGLVGNVRNHKEHFIREHLSPYRAAKSKRMDFPQKNPTTKELTPACPPPSVVEEQNDILADGSRTESGSFRDKNANRS